MSAPGINKLGRVSIMLPIWHLAFMHWPEKVGVVEILVLTSMSTVGRLSICALS